MNTKLKLSAKCPGHNLCGKPKDLFLCLNG